MEIKKVCTEGALSLGGKMKNNNPIKVLFVNMVNPMRDVENSYPPLGPAYLAAYVHKHINNGKVNFQLISADFEAKITELKPDIVGITCVSQNYDRARDLAKFSKSADIPYVLIGGSHISLCPESLDINMDIGVIGEGEVTFLELIKSLIQKGKLEVVELAKIPGLAYWDKDKIQLTMKRGLINDLDSIPMPDRSLFSVDVNKTHMFSSRGCPYRCVFCASSKLWERARFHSAKYIFEEIKTLVNNYGVKRIDFFDDLFVANLKRIDELGDLLEKEKFVNKVQFYILARADLINNKLCKALKKMNVKGVSFGLESGSPEILEYLKGQSVRVEDNTNAVNTIKEHGFWCMGSFVIGTPLDTRQTILETLSFIKKSKLDEFAVYALTPLPGTPIWKYAVDNGLIPKELEKIDWNKIDIEYSLSHDYNIHLAKNLTRQEFYELYLLFDPEKRKKRIKRGLKLLFTNPNRFYYNLSKRARSILSRLQRKQ